jgi:filamentous hemagglutinin family protein
MKMKIKANPLFKLMQPNLTKQAHMRVVLTAFICCAFGHAQALPFGEQVQAGSASFVRNAQSLNINQTSQKAIVNWQSFSIANNETVRLNQPTQGVALFRVVGSDSSQIFGSLSATGSLFLSNPNGVLFGRSAQVDVGSLVATTMRIDNDDFLGSHYQFNAQSDALVSNQGVIRTEDGGYIALLGNTVENSGTLQANNGSVILGSAQSAILDFYGDGLVRVKLNGDAVNAAIKQSGNISADGGAVQLATNARTAAINIDGVIQANSLVERNGVIRLEGGKNAKVSVTGTLSAAGNETSTTGGRIEVTGEQVALFKGAKLDASGDAGGGTVLVGGDYQGKNAQVYNARTTYVDKDASIHVDAKSNGNGGKVIVWADDTTRFYGSISAKGGALSGNGGFVEVSGKKYLDYTGKIDVTAYQGIGGKVFFDPLNIVLNSSTQAAPSNNANSTPDIAFADAPVAGTTTIQISDITGYSEAFFQATNNITVASAITMAANNSIKLEAGNNLTVSSSVITSGTGAVTLKADADNSGTGNLAIGANITSQAGGITLAGATITQSAGNIAATGAANGNAGNISITGTGAVNLGAATITANGGTASAGSAGRNGGVITISGAGVTTTGAKTANGSAGSGASQAGGNAGSVNIASTNGMSVGAIAATGGNAGTGNANAGNAGTIALTNNTTGNIAAGALTARTGVAIGTGAGGTAGSIAVTNTAAIGSLSTGAITTQGNTKGNGGNITLSSLGALAVSGAVTSAGGATTTGNNGQSAGNITITGGNTSVTGAISASGGNVVGITQAGGNAGTVSITATGTLTTAAITSRTGNATGTGAGGTAGGITLSGTSVTSGALTTTGGTNGKGGAVSVSSTTGNLATGAIVASGGGSNASTSGNAAGNISLTSAGSLSTTGVISTIGSTGGSLNQGGGNAANITLNANTGISITGALSADGGNGFAGSTLASAGNAGAVSITNNSSGNISTATLSNIAGQAFGTGAGGTASSIAITNSAATGNVTTSTIRTTGGTNAHGGNVSVLSQANITTGTITASAGALGTGSVSAGRNAGTVALTAGGNVTVSTIAATGGAGLGANQNGGNGGTVNLDAGSGSTITLTNMTTTGGNRTGTGTAGVGGNIAVADAALLSANTMITSTGGSAGVGTGGAVTFGGTVNSSGASRSLAINTNNATTFTGAVGETLALSSLTTNATGSTVLNGGAVTTTVAQTYSDNVTLGAPTTLTTTNSNVTFTAASSVVNAGGNALTIAAGTGAVSATNAANNFANLAITAGSANIRDANAIVLGATNVSGNYTLQTAGAVAQLAAVTIGGTTSITAGATNDVTLNNAANNFNAVAIVSGRDVNFVDANALTVNASSVRIMAAQTLSNDLTLGGAITATGTGSGTSITLASAQNFINAGNFALTPGAGSRWLVYSTNPTADTRGAGLITASNFKQYNAVLGDTILGTGNGFVYSAAPTITASLSGTASKVYDGTTTASIAGLSLGQSGAIDGDTVNLSALTSATYDDKNAGAGKTVSSNALSITGATNGGKQVFGYTLASPNATGNVGTITQRAITVSVATDTKTYDGNTSSVGAPTVTSGSIVAGDSATFSQTFDNKNAGTGKTLTAAGTVADGNGGGNYAVTFVTDNTGVINPLAITGTITANNKTYDANNSAVIASRNLTGVIIGDTVSYAGGTATFDNKNAGTGKTVTATGLGLSGADAGNYTVNTTTLTTADIAKADITAVTGITANNKVYDATTAASLNTGAAAYTGMIGGDNLTVATAAGAFVDQNAGVGKTVNISGISLGGADAGNYNLTATTANTTADISQRAITVTATPGQSKTFGAADPLPFAFTVGGLGLVGADSLTGALDRVAGEVVGGYAINQGTLAASSNYILNYFGNNFNILAPSTTGGGNPRNAAGLVDLNPSLGNYTNQQLFVLNVGFTAAGADSEGNAACEENPESLAKDKDFILMLNYGLKLPKGVNTSCDKT